MLFNQNENINPFAGYRANANDDEEAFEDNGLDGIADDDVADDNEDQIEGDDLDEHMDEDYEARPELDNYDGFGIDDQRQQELNINDRLEVDERLDREQRMREAMQGRRAAALMDDEFEDDEEGMLDNRMRQERMRMMRENGGGADEQDHEDMGNVLDYEEIQGPLNLWLQKPDVIKWVSRLFNAFLRNFKSEADSHRFDYEERIHEMCQNNKQSLEMTFNHLSNKQPTLAIWMAEEPALMLPIFNEVAMDITSELYPDYSRVHD